MHTTTLNKESSRRTLGSIGDGAISSIMFWYVTKERFELGREEWLDYSGDGLFYVLNSGIGDDARLLVRG